MPKLVNRSQAGTPDYDGFTIRVGRKGWRAGGVGWTRWGRSGTRMGRGREAQLVERGPETLQEQRPPSGVVAQQARTAPAAGQSQHCDLVTTSGAVLRNQKFQHCWRAVGETGLGHECLAGVREGAPHRDRPLGLEPGDQSRKVPQPPAGSAGRRSAGHHIGNAQAHFPRFAQAPPGSSCVTTATPTGLYYRHDQPAPPARCSRHPGRGAVVTRAGSAVPVAGQGSRSRRECLLLLGSGPAQGRG